MCIVVLASQVIRGEIELCVCERKFLNATTQMVFTFRRVRIELKGEYRVERWKWICPNLSSVSRAHVWLSESTGLSVVFPGCPLTKSPRRNRSLSSVRPGMPYQIRSLTHTLNSNNVRGASDCCETTNSCGLCTRCKWEVSVSLTCIFFSMSSHNSFIQSPFVQWQMVFSIIPKMDFLFVPL